MDNFEVLSGKELIVYAHSLFASAESWPHILGKTEIELKSQCYTAWGLFHCKNQYKANGNR